MSWHFTHFILCLALFFPAISRTACTADREALDWLDRMSRSLREVSYEGVFTYQHGQSMQALRIRHSVDARAETEQITQLNGDGGAVQRTEHPLDCIHPGSNLVRINSGFQNDDCGLAASYRLQLGSTALVAGRKAKLLRVLPKDMYRYGYQMALDDETGLLLRSETLAQDGKVLEHFQFADLKIGSTARSGSGTQVEVLHEATHGVAGHHTTRSAYGQSGDAWEVNWTPSGFMTTNDAASASAEKTYTDGLAVFSVYLERLGRDIKPGEGRARQGGTTAYTRGMHLNEQPVLVTVIGEVPINTARMVANSVNWLVAAGAN